MLALNHTLVGAAIGSQIDNIPAVIGLAVVSHFVLDFLPHVDQGSEFSREELKPTFKYFLAAIDIFASFLIIILILMARPGLNSIPVITGAITGLLIDLIFNVPFWESWVKKVRPLSYIYYFHNKIQEPLKKYQYSIGIPLQLIIIFTSIWFLIK